ncbi:MAG: hypothetical protein GYA36_19585 [Veillonellaceae bacterium]|nr:hypothetical protein [Veillonellaceae bacterium]
MPAAIHDRAMRLLPEMKKTYSPKKAKSVAFAVATQQAYAKGEAPKKWHGKPFGTPKGKREAKQKFDKPKNEYKSLKEGALVMYRASLSKLAMQGVPGAQAMIVKEGKGQVLRFLRGILGARTGRFLDRLGRGLMFRSGHPVAFMRGAGGEPAMFRALAGTTGAGAASNILAARPNLRARIGQWLQRTGRGLSALPSRAQATASGLISQPVMPAARGLESVVAQPVLGRGAIPAFQGNPGLAASNLRAFVTGGGYTARPGMVRGQRIPIGHGTSKVAAEPELTEGQKRRRRLYRLLGAGLMGAYGAGFGALATAPSEDWRQILAGTLGGGALGAGLGYGASALGEYMQRANEQAFAERMAETMRQMRHRKQAALDLLLEEGERLMKQAADEWMPPVEQERPTTLPYTGPGPFAGRHIVGGRDIGEELYRDLGIMGSGGLRPVDTDTTGDATSSPYGGLGRGTTKVAQATLRETSEPHYPGLSAVLPVKLVKPLKAVKPVRTAVL